MPTILLIMGWRVFFYANEGDEPIHVHCIKGDCECKYWLDVNTFDLEEAYSYNMTARDIREIKKSFFNILIISSSNGMNFRGGVSNESIPQY